MTTELTLAEIKAANNKKQENDNKDKQAAKTEGTNDVAGVPKKGIPMYWTNDEKTAASPVTAYENFVNYNVHGHDENYKRCRKICDEHRRIPCKTCIRYQEDRENEVSDAWKLKARSVKIGPFHIYNLQANPEVTLEDKQTKKEKKVMLKNFVRLIDQPWRLGDSEDEAEGLKTFKNMDADGKENGIPFTNRVFEFCKVSGSGGGLMAPDIMTRADLQSMFGDTVSVKNLPETSKIWHTMTKAEIKIAILNSFEGDNSMFMPKEEPKLSVDDVAADPFDSSASEPEAKDEDLSGIEAAF